MFSNAQHQTPTDGPSEAETAALAVLTRRRLAELDRLRDLGLKQAQRVTAVSKVLSPEHEFKLLTGANGSVLAYERIVRAVRQITVLEFELRGLFKAPDRDRQKKLRLVNTDRTRLDRDNLLGDLYDYDDLNDLRDWNVRPDYKIGPLDEVVAGVRKTLGAEAPADDPFAPPPERKPPEGAVAAPSVSQPVNKAEPAPLSRPPRQKPPMAQAKPALKAMALVLRAMPGKGFRIAPKTAQSPGTPSRPKKRRGNRGPPK